MGDSIKFTIGGQLGTSYRRALGQAETEALASNQRLLTNLARQKASVNAQLGRMEAQGTPGYQMTDLMLKRQSLLRQENILYAAAAKNRTTELQVLEKQNAYLLKKAQIMGTMGSGMAPGFSNLLATEAGTSTSSAQALLDKRNAYLARKSSIMGTTGSGMAPGFAKLLETEAKLATPAVNGLDGALNKVGGHIPGLNLVLRETLVIFREIGRGNWARVPGSFSLVLQGLRQMRGELGIFGAIFTLTGAVVVGSVAAIVASFFIWEHRVNSLAKALESLKVPDIAPPDISRLTAFEKGWNRIRDAIAEAAAEINNANANFERTKGLLDQAQSTEKRLLEIEKQKALEAATDPVAKARVRAEYAKKEHDLQKKQQDEQMAADAKHIQDLQVEQDAKTEAARAMKVETEADEKVHQEILDKAAKEGTEKRKDKKGNEIDSQLEEDQKTVEKYQGNRLFQEQGLESFLPKGSTDRAIYDAAQGRLDAHKTAVEKKTAYDLAKKDREEARKEQTRLFDEAAKAGADKIKAAKAYNQAMALNARILSDDDKIRAAENSKDDTKDSEHGRALKINATDWEKAGGAFGGRGMSMLDIGKQQLSELKGIHHEVKNNKKKSRGVNFGH